MLKALIKSLVGTVVLFVLFNIAGFVLGFAALGGIGFPLEKLFLNLAPYGAYLAGIAIPMETTLIYYLVIFGILLICFILFRKNKKNSGVAM